MELHKTKDSIRWIVVSDEIASCEQNGYAVPFLQQILTACGVDKRYQVVRLSKLREGLVVGTVPYALITRQVAQPAEELARFTVCVCDYDYDLALPQGEAFPESCKLLTYSTTSDNADFTARNVRSFQDKGFAFEMVGVGVIGRIQLSNGSEQTVRCSLIAASAALACGIPFAEVLEALNHISPQSA